MCRSICHNNRLFPFKKSQKQFVDIIHFTFYDVKEILNKYIKNLYNNQETKKLFNNFLNVNKESSEAPNCTVVSELCLL